MSIKKNSISAVLNNEEIEAAIAGLKAVEAAFPFAETLRKQDRQAMPRIGARLMNFNKMAYQYADRNPGLIPTYIDVSELKKDLDLAEALDKIMNSLVTLTVKLKDSSTLAKVDAYENARMIYHSIKAAAKAGMPGASAIADEMGKAFKTSRSAKKAQETGQEEPREMTEEAAING